jgi:hypothetical protein
MVVLPVLSRLQDLLLGHPASFHLLDHARHDPVHVQL